MNKAGDSAGKQQAAASGYERKFNMELSINYQEIPDLPEVPAAHRGEVARPIAAWDATIDEAVARADISALRRNIESVFANIGHDVDDIEQRLSYCEADVPTETLARMRDHALEARHPAAQAAADVANDAIVAAKFRLTRAGDPLAGVSTASAGAVLVPSDAGGQLRLLERAIARGDAAVLAALDRRDDLQLSVRVRLDKVISSLRTVEQRKAATAAAQLAKLEADLLEGDPVTSVVARGGMFSRHGKKVGMFIKTPTYSEQQVELAKARRAAKDAADKAKRLEGGSR